MSEDIGIGLILNVVFWISVVLGAASVVTWILIGYGPLPRARRPRRRRTADAAQRTTAGDGSRGEASEEKGHASPSTGKAA